MTCVACDAKNAPIPCPVIGNVCEKCFRKLCDPVRECGVITNVPIMEICARTAQEFSGRKSRLIQRARIVCKEQGGR